MTVEAGIELTAMPNLEDNPSCEVVWAKDEGMIPCTNIATWQAWAHDEFEDHDWCSILMCGKCVNIVKMKTNPCDCGENEFIRHLRKL